MTIYSYACSDYPGMEDCPGKVQAASESELRQLMDLHARVAHGEDPAAWSEEERAQINALIKIID
ncbi:MAG: putative small metal-binding protein [Parasphingorhabdus sp.]|jgi:predicted small metal-binding protein